MARESAIVEAGVEMADTLVDDYDIVDLLTRLADRCVRLLCVAATESQRINEQLSGALTSRIAIEQAKGVISERAGLSLDEAFTRLRSHARNNNLRLSDVARAAVDGTLDTAAWRSAPPESRT